MIKKCIIFLFSLCLPLLFLPVQNVYADYAGYTLEGVAVGLRSPDNSSDLVRKFFSSATTTGIGRLASFSDTSSNWSYIRLYFPPFNPGRRDFSLSFVIGSTQYGSNGIGALNLVGGQSLSINVTPITDLGFSVDNLTTATFEQLYFVNISGTGHAHYWGSSTDHLDLYWGENHSGLIITQPSLTIADNVGFEQTRNYQLEVQSYLSDILDALGDLDTQSIVNAQNETTESVDNLNNTIVQQQQAENNAMNNSQSSADSSADSSGAQAEAQGTTLLQILQGFASAIATPSSGSCVINMDLSGYGAGNYPMDLCQLSPPSAVTGLLSVVVVGFVIKAVLSTIEAMLALYKEYQS